MADAKQDRGRLVINDDECKGCGLCVAACPPKVIELGERLNPHGYRTAIYAGAGCTGCGICFLACPEPGAIAVYRLCRNLAANTRGRVIQMQGVPRCASN